MGVLFARGNERMFVEVQDVYVSAERSKRKWCFVYQCSLQRRELFED